MNIPFCVLSKLFPKDTMWVSGCAEIIGYSPKENLHIVIEDGNCISEDGNYVVHKYQPSNPKEHFENWNKGEYPYKYLLSEPKVFEGIVNFNI